MGTIVDHLGATQKRIQLRQTALFNKAEPDHGSRVAEGLGLDVEEVKRFAAMSAEEQARAKAMKAGSMKTTGHLEGGHRGALLLL